MTLANLESDRRAMLQAMNSYRREKNDGWEVRTVRDFPPLSSLKAMTYLGSFAWTQPHTKIKWIKERFAQNTGAGWVTPSEIARDYIAVKYGDARLRCNKKQWAELVRKKIHQPIYAEPIELEHGYYLDLVSAYWQILMLGGWNVDYMPGRYLSPRSVVTDFPVPEIKLARNCLISMGLPSGANVWLPETGLVKQKATRKNVNLILWSFAMDVLHGIASDMVQRACAFYVNTDGYIVSREQLGSAFEVADSWGLSLAIKHEGRITIRGAGDYDIGKRMSGRMRTVPRKFSYLSPRAKDWLKRRVKHFSYRVDLSLRNVSLGV